MLALMAGGWDKVATGTYIMDENQVEYIVFTR